MLECLKRAVWVTMVTCLLICLAGVNGNYNTARETCASSNTTSESRVGEGASMKESETTTNSYTEYTPIEDVISDPVFGEYGRLIFPMYDPPTFACVGDNDGIANWRTMEQRLDRMAALGIGTEFHHYPGLGHDFGV